MSNQGTLRVTIIVEGQFDDAPGADSRTTLSSNGFERNGYTLKKIARAPARRLSEADFVQAAVKLTAIPQS